MCIRDSHEGSDQRDLASEFVTDVAKEDPADRTDEKRDRKSGIGEQQPARFVMRGKKSFDENERCDRPIQEIVVPLNRAADEACDEGLRAQPGWSFGSAAACCTPLAVRSQVY